MLHVFPVRYKTDHDSWSISLLELQSVVTQWISTFNIQDTKEIPNTSSHC